jgi:predicted Zn-dependent protease
MNPNLIANLEKLLDGPRDGAMLRFSLGNAWLTADAAKAASYFRDAVTRDPDYSAAWKGLGKALATSGDTAAALAAYEEGLRVAQARGDLQAAREMQVFARRLAKQRDAGGTNTTG